MWSLNAQERRKIEVSEMKCLRIRRVDRVRNAIIRKRCGCELSVLERIERNVLKWFWHVEEWERKRWLRECIRQTWRVTG